MTERLILIAALLICGAGARAEEPAASGDNGGECQPLRCAQGDDNAQAQSAPTAGAGQHGDTVHEVGECIRSSLFNIKTILRRDVADSGRTAANGIIDGTKDPTSTLGDGLRDGSQEINRPSRRDYKTRLSGTPENLRSSCQKGQEPLAKVRKRFDCARQQLSSLQQQFQQYTRAMQDVSQRSQEAATKAREARTALEQARAENDLENVRRLTPIVASAESEQKEVDTHYQSDQRLEQELQTAYQTLQRSIEQNGNGGKFHSQVQSVLRRDGNPGDIVSCLDGYTDKVSQMVNGLSDNPEDVTDQTWTQGNTSFGDLRTRWERNRSVYDGTYTNFTRELEGVNLPNPHNG